MSRVMDTNLPFPTTPSPHSPDTSLPGRPVPIAGHSYFAGHPTYGKHRGDAGRKTEESKPRSPKHPPEEALSAIKERAVMAFLQVLSLNHQSSKMITGFLFIMALCLCQF